MLEELETLLRQAQEALDKAVTLVENAESDEPFGPPGRMYLVARLDTALDIIESELPEFQTQKHLNLLQSLADDEG